MHLFYSGIVGSQSEHGQTAAGLRRPSRPDGALAAVLQRADQKTSSRLFLRLRLYRHPFHIRLFGRHPDQPNNPEDIPVSMLGKSRTFRFFNKLHAL